MALAEFRREVAILRACRDVNIVQFIVSSPCSRQRLPLRRAAASDNDS